MTKEEELFEKVWVAALNVGDARFAMLALNGGVDNTKKKRDVLRQALSDYKDFCHDTNSNQEKN